MADTKGILHALSFDGDGKGHMVYGDDIAKASREETPSWVHLDMNEPNSRKWLESEAPYLDPIIINALTAEATRPRILEFEEGTLLILRGINLNENAEPEDMVSTRLWIDPYRVISVQRQSLKSIGSIRKRLLSGKGPKDTGDFLVMLASHLFDRMEPFFSALDEHLDDVEERVMDLPDTKDRQAITTIRKQAILYRRYIAPQRDVIAALRTSEQAWLNQIQRRRMQEFLDRIIRYIEDLDTIRERAQIVKDELANGLSDRMNKNLYMLSVVAAIFLPLGFLTGLLGINVGGIPGAENNWAFWMFCGFLAGIIFFQILLFKKLKWF